MKTLAEAITKYSDMAIERSDVPFGSRIHQVCCGGYGLAELFGYPDGADLGDDKRAHMIINLFGQEAFCGDIGEAYSRALRRIGGETVAPKTVTGVVVVEEGWPDIGLDHP